MREWQTTTLPIKAKYIYDRMIPQCPLKSLKRINLSCRISVMVHRTHGDQTVTLVEASNRTLFTSNQNQCVLKTERETCHVIWLQGKPLSNSIYQMQDACTVLISQQIIHDSKLGRIRLKKFLVKLEEPFRRYKQTVLITTQVSKSNMMHSLSFPQVYP